MPIRPDLRQFYGTAWRAVRRRILERAGGKYLGGAKCERCGVPDHRVVERRAGYWRLVIGGCRLSGTLRKANEHASLWQRVAGVAHAVVLPALRWLPRGSWHDTFGAILRRLPEKTPKSPRVLRVVLTVAHLNHTPGDDRDENLAALCQWSHFNHDKEHHKETRQINKDAERPLLDGNV